jgi:hypothetical protein
MLLKLRQLCKNTLRSSLLLNLDQLRTQLNVSLLAVQIEEVLKFLPLNLEALRNLQASLVPKALKTISYPHQDPSPRIHSISVMAPHSLTLKLGRREKKTPSTKTLERFPNTFRNSNKRRK